MPCRLPLSPALILVGFALISCTEDPTKPGTVTDQSSAGPQFAWVSNSWATRARLPTTRQDHAVGVVNNPAGHPILYVFGGSQTDGRNVTSIQAYDYVSNTWTTKLKRFERSYLNGVGVIGGKLYLAGGAVERSDGSYQYFKTLYAYDPVADVLVTKADMPRNTAGGISAVIGGKLYVLTGVCQGCTPRVSRRFYRYDPATNVWSSLPWAPHAHAAGVGGVINGRFYVAGGYAENETVTVTVDVYDPVRNKWSPRASLPDDDLTESAGAVLNSKLYVVGGWGRLGLGKLYAYDPVSNTWTAKAPLPTPRLKLAAATVTASGSSRMLALGGITEARTMTPANEAYKP
jgi:N-acetylneuraminic acid mutarotase